MGKVESLSKALEDMAAEQLAAERAQKANNIANNLRKEADTERQSSAALGTQVNLLTKRLEDARAVGLAAVELYANALCQFGGVISSVPSDPLAHNIFSSMKSNFAKLPDIVVGAIDFGVLSSATNLSKSLVSSGYKHVEGLNGQEFKSPEELGESSRDVTRLVRNFMKSFWLKFGQADARSLAKAWHATVCYLYLVLCFIFYIFAFCLLFAFCTYNFCLYVCKICRRRRLNALLQRCKPPRLVRRRARSLHLLLLMPRGPERLPAPPMLRRYSSC